MSSIQTNVGLITGIPIQDTVDQLIEISSIPRNNLITRTQGLQSEQAAVDQLSSLVLGLQVSLSSFSSTSTFGARSALSSNSSAVAASVSSGGSPAIGSYQFTPLQSASAHQLVSGSFADISDAVGDGTLKFRFGGQVDKGISLADLNDGAGVAAGSIKITDASGATAIVDLRAAQNVDDVLLAINSATSVNVTATTDGDQFVLTDNSGGSGSLVVQDVGLGTTAADLGLVGSSSSGTLTGADAYRLSDATRLDSLNDGGGVRITDDLTDIADLTITLSDGTQADIDLSGSTTLGDVIDAINAATDTDGATIGSNLSAAISGDGNRITITDGSGGTGNLVIADGALGSAATDLGIVADTAATSVTGSRLVSGLQDTLVASLNGGQGYTLGDIQITDSGGGSPVTVSLGSAETLGEIVDAINNASGLDVTAAINSNRSGIVITDDAGGTLTVVNGSSGTTADDLGITTSSGSSVDSGSLNRQTISEATLLSDFNGGQGVALGDFRITDSAGTSYAIDLNTSGDEAETIGDVIDRINAAAGNTTVTASLNATGDGILLTDTAGGSGTLTVAEVGNGTAAADLNLVGASTTTNGSGQQTIDGTTGYSVDLSDLTQSDTSISLSSLNGGSGVDLGIFEIVDSAGNNAAIVLNEPGNEAFTIGDVIDEINASSIGVTASVNSAGTGILLTDTAGGDGELTVNDLGSDTTASDLNLIRTSADTSSTSIDGAGLFTATDAEQGALATLAGRINDLGAGVTASVFSDAGGFRLSLTSDTTGAANELLIDSSATDLSFIETSRPTDAVAIFGSASGSGGIAVTSTDNQFNGVVDGLDITVNDATGESVTLDVASDTSAVVSAVQGFVDSYNSIRANLDQVTAFDAEAATTGILFGRNEAVRVDTELARIVSGSFSVSGSLTSLEAIGVSLNDDGTLSLSTSELQSALATNATDVEQLFADETNGVVAELTAAINQLATDENSLLTARSDALQRTIDTNNERIADYNLSLELERERLLLEFFQLEETIARLQTNLDTISSFQPLAPLSVGNSNNN
ncbi:MAG: flagellar filament capping protein FliD [Planctomycetota bacterium]